MIKVIVRCFVQEQGIAEFIRLAGQLAAKARQEPGCVSYQVCQNRNAPQTISLMEVWESDAVLHHHLEQDYFKTLSAQCVALQSGETEYEFHEVVG